MSVLSYLWGVAQGVVTRAQAEKAGKPIRPLAAAPMPDASAVDVEGLKKAQKDPALDRLGINPGEKQICHQGTRGPQIRGVHGCPLQGSDRTKG